MSTSWTSHSNSRRNAPSLGRIVVIGHRPEATAHQEKPVVRARPARGAGPGSGPGHAPASVVERGRALPSLLRVPDGSAADALSALISTSESTGTPMGAMYTEYVARRFRVDFVPGQPVRPAIVLHCLP
ncbi:hypothetical protein ACH4PU_19810 [Streptomyces sp. NPDC021100]|uniref:hypothetical protein n=1 Tax=Streptomyces sp. NPDC021100 TaxID=3365114 RepID=UPI00379F28EE